jgi:hypothetical protein
MPENIKYDNFNQSTPEETDYEKFLRESLQNLQKNVDVSRSTIEKIKHYLERTLTERIKVRSKMDELNQGFKEGLVNTVTPQLEDYTSQVNKWFKIHTRQEFESKNEIENVQRETSQREMPIVQAREKVGFLGEFGFFKKRSASKQPAPGAEMDGPGKKNKPQP